MRRLQHGRFQEEDLGRLRGCTSTGRQCVDPNSAKCPYNVATKRLLPRGFGARRWDSWDEKGDSHCASFATYRPPRGVGESIAR
jgi:hypothetical protein